MHFNCCARTLGRRGDRLAAEAGAGAVKILRQTVCPAEVI